MFITVSILLVLYLVAWVDMVVYMLMDRSAACCAYQ